MALYIYTGEYDHYTSNVTITRKYDYDTDHDAMIWDSANILNN